MNRGIRLTIAASTSNSRPYFFRSKSIGRGAPVDRRERVVIIEKYQNAEGPAIANHAPAAHDLSRGHPHAQGEIGNVSSIRRGSLWMAGGVACSLTALAASAAGQQAPAAMFGGDPQHSGVVAAAPVYSLTGVRFAFRTDGPIRATPAIVDGIVYFGSGDGRFYAVDGRTGLQRWSFQSGGAIHASAAILASVAYFASRDGFLYALRTADGKLLWKLGLGKDLGNQNYWDYHLSSPTLFDGHLYVGSGDGHLYAIDLQTHQPVWRFNAGSRIRSTPAVTADAVVFGTLSGHVIALNRANGTPRWKYATQGAAHVFADAGNDTTSIVTSPSISDGIVVAGARDGFLYGIDLASGQEKWHITHDGSSWIPSTAIEQGTVYVGSGSAQIVQAADLQTGAERWRFKTSGAVFSSPTLAGDTLLISDFAGNIYALDRGSGSERWRFAIGQRSLSTPVAAGGSVYCGADDGYLYALGGSTVAPVTPVVSPARLVVYWEGKKSAQAFSWFLNNVDLTVLNYFKAAGYEQLDEPQLTAFLQQESQAKAHSVVVFADNRIPAALADVDSDRALIRRYLDAGGKAVIFGSNPLAYRGDPKTGVVEEVDFSVPARVFGMQFPQPSQANGYYGTQVTADGARWGLRGFGIGSNPVDPHQVSETLAVDEYGMASSWVKNYGGPEGTGLLQLTIPRAAPIDLATDRAAIEFGVR
jgi:outer membrane protein assembly factor BamB